ncbi:hypothetical protein ACHAQD_007155 [Fusarium lateritium]
MDSAPLLQNTDGLPSPNVMQDHPAFLRAAHSPWSFIPQNVLVILRGIVLALVTAVGILILNFEFHENTEYSNWRIIFDFANISFFFIFLYQLKTFVSLDAGRILWFPTDFGRVGLLPTCITHITMIVIWAA